MTELRDHWLLVGSGWYWIMAFALFGMLARGGLALNAAPSFETSASVLLDPLSPEHLDRVNQRNTIDPWTERQIALSGEIAMRAADALQVDPGELSSLRAPLDVVVAEESQVLLFTYVAPDPDVAASSVNAFADAYLEYRTEQAADLIATVSDGLQSRFEALVSERALLEDELQLILSSDDDAEKRDELQGRLAEAVLQLNLVESDLSALPARSLPGGHVISRASPPTDAGGWVTRQRGVEGLVYGALLGWAVLMTVHTFGRRVRGDDVATRLLEGSRV